jgi:hypothetical protein
LPRRVQSDRKPSGGVINVLLDGEELEALDELASRLEVDRTEVMVRALAALRCHVMICTAPSAWRLGIRSEPGSAVQ